MDILSTAIDERVWYNARKEQVVQSRQPALEPTLESALESALEPTLDAIAALAKRRGFVYPTSEIYGGLANTYDYGPLGAQLLKNIRDR